MLHTVSFQVSENRTRPGDRVRSRFAQLFIARQKKRHVYRYILIRIYERVCLSAHIYIYSNYSREEREKKKIAHSSLAPALTLCGHLASHSIFKQFDVPIDLVHRSSDLALPQCHLTSFIYYLKWRIKRVCVCPLVGQSGGALISGSVWAFLLLSRFTRNSVKLCFVGKCRARCVGVACLKLTWIF